MAPDATIETERTEAEISEIAGKLRPLVAELQDLSLADLEEVKTETLADLEDALKCLDDAAEEARKEAVEAELDDRVSIGGSVGNISRREGHSKFVYDDAAAIERLEEAGVDPTEAMTVKASALVEVAEQAGIDSDELVGKAEYTYYRR
ncbi:hypothetical protein [Halorhabdus tiamatea]|nr:hypothetical protein [Halorhabdus tiamatea]